MPPEVRDLVALARQVQGIVSLTDDLTAGEVAAALRTRSGTIVSGICLNVTCGLGMGAERAAVVEMLKSHETEVELIVAVRDSEILSPCGCCRELLVQIDRRNLDTRVILSESRIVHLRDLRPEHWLVS